MCVHESVSVSERKIVCVREKEANSVCVCMRESVFVRERERESVCVREREREREEYVCNDLLQNGLAF